MGTAGGPGDPRAADPINRLSSKVNAVACFCPPSDFLNWGSKGKEMLNRSFQPPFTAATDYHEFDKARALFVRSATRRSCARSRPASPRSRTSARTRRRR